MTSVQTFPRRRKSFARSARTPVSIVTEGIATTNNGEFRIGDVIAYESTFPENNFIGKIIGWAPYSTKGIWPGAAFTDEPRVRRQPIARILRMFRHATAAEIAIWEGQAHRVMDYVQEVRPPHVVRELARQQA